MWAQTRALFLREMYLTLRSWTSLMMLFLPIIFIYIGVLVGKYYVLEMENISDGTKIFFVGIFIVQAFCINSSIYINTTVLERETKMKNNLQIMGCHLLPYWLGTFLFDYLTFFVTQATFFLLI